MMNTSLASLIIVYVVLHVILFFVEWYRYSHSSWSWYGFKNNGMLWTTYIVLAIDTYLIAAIIIGAIIYWILQPTI